MPLNEPTSDPHWPNEAELDAVVAEFGGDLRKALAAVLHDLSALATDYESSVSRGYVRGEVPKRCAPRNCSKG